MIKTTEEIISLLPYQEPFLFVDKIESISDEGCTGYYTLQPDAFFYKGHFKDHPVTPGVILTEIMAQIGLVCLGIYLSDVKLQLNQVGVAMSSTHMEFLKSVLPSEKVKVTSLKQYFRFNKLKCEVRMFNELNILVAKGTISGMIVPISNEK
ncbi:beta-hydroxyacyl-ACP dehydratase [Aquimarina sp. ERC-38]|uniref:3-hydroxyacyl-ACP dehydratase FabZ family protein n=1 Tax=Aquimarina sp. ERC-38 TaxID=2949996 RepID=UPI002247E6EA|nr:3-hydroxyacyl-ACP dehydratase FabZ family protein [Aquimarina sp. ERC-38]UZO80125.1 beta-hydroxyacyl-ACP dehydratase [Aquimarina sp. ERC-38]